MDEPKKRRRKWTKEMNADVIRAYYQATENGTNTLNICGKFLERWRILRPDVNITAGNLFDRRRYILNNRILSETDLDSLRIENGIIVAQGTIDDPVPNRTEKRSQYLLPHLAHGDPESDIQDEIMTRTTEEFERVLEKYKDIPPLSRPSIPKMKVSELTRKVITCVNTVLQSKITDEDSITDTHLLAYCAAVTTINTTKTVYMDKGRRKGSCTKDEQRGVNKNTALGNKLNTKFRNGQPAWRRRLEAKTAGLRSRISKLRNWLEIQGYKRKYDVEIYLRSQNIGVQEIGRIRLHLDCLKQKLIALGNRLRRYNKAMKRKQQNALFNRDQKRFYRTLGQKNEEAGTEGPTGDQIEMYWGQLWKNIGSHKTESSWLMEERSESEKLEGMPECVIDQGQLKRVLSKLSNWKTAGPDGLQNFWWKQLWALHDSLVRQINESFKQPALLPSWLMRGNTTLIYKGGNRKEPQNYRPITCLNSIYKIVTALIGEKISIYLEQQGIISEEQKGCRKGSRGCKEQLVIDRVVTEQARKKNRNLFIAWIDYKKAYDSVPHSWLVEILYLYKVHPNLIDLLKRCMSEWRTIVRLKQGNTWAETGIIEIGRGIFQGDSLSPTWFCVALNPLSRMLNSGTEGYKLVSGNLRSCITHLLYLDDLKLYTGTAKQRHKQLEKVAEFNDDVQMELGLDKCACIDILRGKVQAGTSSNTLGIEYLQDQYKYLGFKQELSVTRSVKDELKQSFFQRAEKILKSLLNSGNMFRALNVWAAPILTYSFGVLGWSNTEIEAVNRQLRTMLTTHRMHHPRAALERLYLPRKEGGRGLVDLKCMMDKQVCNMKTYFLGKTETSCLHKYVAQSDDSYTPLNLRDPGDFPNPTSTEDRVREWKSKSLHGRFFTALEGANKAESVHWLRTGVLYPETEGFMLAIQDEVMATRNYRKHILKENIVDVCRVCSQGSETIQHLCSGCPLLANTEYLRRHNLTCNILHQYYAAEFNFLNKKDLQPHYKYVPNQVEEDAEVTLYYDWTIQTDKKIPHNRPDVVLINRNTSEAILFDVSHPLNVNMQRAAQERANRYFELAEELKKMRKLKMVKVIPIIISCTGLVQNSLLAHFAELNIPLNILHKMQKSVILDTCRIIRKYLHL